MWCKLSGSNSRLQVSVEPCFEDQPPATVSSCRIFKSYIQALENIASVSAIDSYKRATNFHGVISIVYILLCKVAANWHVQVQTKTYISFTYDILRISRLSASKSSPVKRPLLRCPVLRTFAPTPLLATLCLLSLSAPGLQGPRQGFFTAGHVAYAPEFLKVPLKSPWDIPLYYYTHKYNTKLFNNQGHVSS